MTPGFAAPAAAVELGAHVGARWPWPCARHRSRGRPGRRHGQRIEARGRRPLLRRRARTGRRDGCEGWLSRNTCDPSRGRRSGIGHRPSRRPHGGAAGPPRPSGASRAGGPKPSGLAPPRPAHRRPSRASASPSRASACSRPRPSPEPTTPRHPPHPALRSEAPTAESHARGRCTARVATAAVESGSSSRAWSWASARPPSPPQGEGAPSCRRRS